jgi:hypothetical protein
MTSLKDSQQKTFANEKILADTIYTHVPNVFPKELIKLISSYAIVPQLYSFEVRGNELCLFEHPKCGLLLLMYYGVGIEIYSENDNWKRITIMIMPDANHYLCRGVVWNEKLLITDLDMNCIHCIDVTEEPDKWSLEKSFGSTGCSDDQFREPASIVICDNLCFVHDSRNKRIQCFILTLDNGLCSFHYHRSIRIPGSISEIIRTDCTTLVISCPGKLKIIDTTDMLFKEIKTVKKTKTGSNSDYLVSENCLYSLCKNIITIVDKNTLKIIKGVEIQAAEIFEDDLELVFASKTSLFIRVLEGYLMLVIHKAELL